MRAEGRSTATAAMGVAALSNQVGAAIGTTAFPAMGPVGVVAVRQYVAAIVLLVVTRPPLRSLTREQWRPIVLLAAILATMNLSLYTAIDRIGLGLAVTLEFLGPLTVALASSRRRFDIGCALVAAAGAITLMRPRPSNDYLGIALALLAAGCWASYILVNRAVGRRVTGTTGTAAASTLSALAYVPVGVLVLVHDAPGPKAWLCAAAAGVLASAIPYAIDMFALRHVAPQAFGLFMSVNPVLAGLVGWIGLGELLDGWDWLGIGAVVVANAAGVRPAALWRRRGSRDRGVAGARDTEQVVGA